MNTQLIIGVLNATCALLAAVAVLGFQIHTYRKTRHRSSLLLLTGSILGISCFLLMSLPWLAPRPAFSATPFLVLTSALFLIQAALNVWGSAELFSAFRRLFRSAKATTRHEMPIPGAESTTSPSSPVPAAEADHPTSERRGRGAPLTDAMRLWVLVPLRGDPGHVTDAFLALLCVITLLIWAALNRWHIGADAEFMSWNIPTLCLYALLPLGFAYVAARLSVPRTTLRSMIFAAVSLMPLLAVLTWLLETRTGHRAENPARITFWLYVCVYMLVALRRVTGRWQWRASSLLILLLGGFFILSEHVFWSADLWFAPDKSAANDIVEKRDTAALLFNQRSKIDETVAAMTVEATPMPKVFFVGFAGVDRQKVFAEEIKLAAHVIADRFGSGQRQLLLVNDRRDLDYLRDRGHDQPCIRPQGHCAADGPGSRRAVLSLSSHGGSDPLLSVSNGYLTLDQLSGNDLVQALAASGIKRRVVIISACHAGAFIPALKNPDTIVITAAAADKTSFGCADDRDLTYFGEAFYRDALPHAESLEVGFQAARSAIADRERRENQTPSDPQSYFGSELTRALIQIRGINNHSIQAAQ